MAKLKRKHKANINGCAASIECYLDLRRDSVVRWTSYNSNMGTYQGELIDKTAVARGFLKQRKRQPNYDYSRIEAVLDMLVTECARMREAEEFAKLEI